ncbi:MAG: DNA polymerase Y family protein [Proteobacteria bacterium]|nr:DNA polymerase Y family protein [Pseudomonadota bacterium]
MHPHLSPTPLWLALHLPYLPLEANAPLSSPSAAPVAIIEQGRIVVCDQAARQAGIENGIGVAAARMLEPSIALIARNPACEAAALHSLACWAGGFTPRVSLTPDTLLLEIGSCLRLFGGLKKLVRAAIEGMQAQDFTVATAAAPTPLGAQWLAQAGKTAHCLDSHTLHQHLETLPIAVLPGKAAASLARFGASTLADVRRLPSAALARRIGVDTLNLIARAFGEIADPRADFVFPDRFALSLQLPASVETAAGLLFAARRLTSALAGWLAARQAGVREFTLRLQHGQEETQLVLQFAELTADGRRFERMLRERVERMALHAPVESLRLEATNVFFRPGRNQALFDDAHADQDAIGALFERLSARLGDQQVYRVALRDDHRPECATRHVTLFEKTSSSAATALPRPLWLLDQPESLREVDGRPYRQGHLKLLAGPERIESGWWDGGESTGDVGRDYFIALSANAGWLWIYRECRTPGGWFLQGFFS